MVEFQKPKEQLASYDLFEKESGMTIAYLLDQAQFCIENMGGLFPEQTNKAGLHDVLDLASGPGGWAHEVAREYPDIEVIGVDIHSRMIVYAQAITQVLNLPNVHFSTMNMFEALPFPDASFDLVNATILVNSIRRDCFPHLLAECKRVLRPEGLLRWSELEWGRASTPAVEQLQMLHHKILHTAGYKLSSSGHFLGITHEMTPLLQEAGFEQLQRQLEFSDISYGTKAHRGAVENRSLLFHFLRAPLLAHKLISQQEYNELYEQALLELQSKDFHCLGFFLSICGKKGSQDNKASLKQ